MTKFLKNNGAVVNQTSNLRDVPWITWSLILCAIGIVAMVLIGQIYSASFVFKAASILQLAIGILLLPISLFLSVIAFSAAEQSKTASGFLWRLTGFLIYAPSIAFIVGGCEGLVHEQRYGWAAIYAPWVVVAIGAAFGYVCLKLSDYNYRTTNQ